MKSKAELRPGFLTDRAWLRTVNCCPAGFYSYAVIRKPLGSDCLRLSMKFVAGEFDVRQATLTSWLDQLEGWGLTWRHPVQYGVCLHFEKPGDYRGGNWVPCEPSHLDMRPMRITENRNPDPANSITDLRNAEGVRITVSPHPRFAENRNPRSRSTMRNNKLHRSPQSSSPRESSPGAAAPRSPDGARGVALTAEEQQEFARDVDALPDPLRRVFSKVRDRIAAEAAPAGAMAGLRVEDSPEDG